MFNGKFSREMAATKRIATDFGSIYMQETPSKWRETISSSQDNSSTGVAGQIQWKYRRKQLEHLPLSTTARRMLTLSFSMAVKYVLNPKDLRFPAGTLSLRWRRTLQTRCQPFQQYAIALVSLHVLKPEINLKTVFSNTQHFATCVRCMPSRCLQWLDTPLFTCNVWKWIRNSYNRYVWLT